MTKEKIQREDTENIIESGLAGPIVPSLNNLDAIKVDSPPGTPEEFIEKNFDALAEIYRMLNSPRSRNST